MPRFLSWPILATLFWGILAFGAITPWAYRPLMVVWATLGAVGLIAGRGARVPWPVAAGLAVVALAAAVQLVPLPYDTFVRVTPGADALLRQYDLTYAIRVSAYQSGEIAVPASSAALTRPISIAPDATRRGLMLLTVLSVFLLGLTCLFSRFTPASLIVPLLVFGTLVALFGIVQKALVGHEQTMMYGFYELRRPTSNAFGPFVNRNHYAGWVLLVLPLALAYLHLRVLEGLRSVRSGWRNRLLWLGSPEGSWILLLAFAVLIMGASIVLSLSRSGIVGFAVIVAVWAWFVTRTQRSRRQQLITAGALSLVLILAAAWAGTDAALARFVRSSVEIEGRIGAWQDTLRIIRDFSLTGTGFNTYRTAMLVYQTSGRHAVFQEAHNEYLQIVAEGGLLLAVPAFVTLGLFVREIRLRFRERADDPTTYWIRAGAVTAIVAIAVQSLIEFSLQLPGNAAVFALVAAIAMHRPAPGASRRADAART